MQLPWLVRKNYFHLMELTRKWDTEKLGGSHQWMWDWVCWLMLSCTHTLAQILSLQKPTFSNSHSSRDTEKKPVILKDPLELLFGQNKSLPAPWISIMAHYCPSDFQENTYYVRTHKQPVSPSSAAVISDADGELRAIRNIVLLQFVKTFLYRSIIIVAFQGKCFPST